MQLIPLPAFADNYIWLLHTTTEAVVVDPGDAKPVLNWLQQHPHIQLKAILVTHHHADHVGGVAELQAHTLAEVFAPRRECPQLTAHRVEDGQTLEWLGHNWQVLEVPGHTAGHVAYVCQSQPAHLFCGDTLFGAGCGRLFEGTPAQMAHSLQRLMTLPANTWVCPAHEYTLSNLAFANAVEPNGPALNQRLQRDRSLREQGHPTLPSTLQREADTNPFLRTHLPTVQAAAAHWAQSQPNGDPTDTTLAPETRCLARLREWKNRF